MSNSRYFKPTLLAIAIATGSSPAYSQQLITSNIAEQTQWPIKLSAGPLANSLNTLARQTGLTLSADPALLKGVSAAALSGNYTVAKALSILLDNSALQAVKLKDGSYAIKKSSSQNIAGTLALTTVGNEGSFGDAPAEEGGF